MLDRHQGHQLQLHPPLPVALQLPERLPADRRGRAEAVDVAAHRSQAVAPGQLQGPLTPLPHHIPGAAAVFAGVGGEGAGEAALGVGEGRRREGLVEVGVGFHQRRERQRRAAGGRGGPDRAQLPPLMHQGDRHQPLVVGGRQLRQAWIEQCSWQPQRWQPDVVAHSPPPGSQAWRGRSPSGPLSLARTTTKRPATARVSAS